MASQQPKILLSGATGYIGGSVLDHLLKSIHPAIKDNTITCLVRGEERAAKLTSVYGRRVNPVLFKDIDDTERVIAVASEHDIVINTLLGYHPASAAALVEGLAKRKQQTGKEVYMIHTSGVSNLADMPITKQWVEPPNKEFDDSKDDIYGYEKMRNEKHPYLQRTSELGVIDTGITTGVKTLIIMSPLIYGAGRGLFNRSSIQVPSYVRASIKNGQAVVVGEGNSVWGNVHMDDLAELYLICLADVIETGGMTLPFGKKGIIFSETARHTWLEVAQGVADAAYAAGAIKTREVKHVSLKEGAQVLAGGDELLCELGFSSNSRTKAVIAPKLGWKPTKGKKDFERGFSEEVDAATKGSA